MKLAKQARQRLKGQWRGAMAAEWMLVTAGLVLLLLEVLSLRLSGIGIETVLHFDELVVNTGMLPHALIIVGIVLLDILVTSPLRAGQAAYYYRTADPARTEYVSSGILRCCYTRGSYGRAVRWRLILWWYRLLWGSVCTLPAAMLLGYGQLLFQRGGDDPVANIQILFCGFFGLFALLAGFVTMQLILLRYMPAQYFLAEEKTVRGALRRGKQLMKGRVGEAAWMAAGFSGWLLTCLLLVPYFYVAPLYRPSRALWVRRKEAERLREVQTELGRTRAVDMPPALPAG